ncbi:MAG: rhodanese-like domain-containing protein [Flavobacteriaceae bacterium]|nr:rhodanese-like domain-containing protein [Flavobacteriaceae bacterium]
MKELEKTKRISISAVIFLLVIVIALLTYRRPKHLFSTDSKTTLNEMLGKDYIISSNGLKALDTSSYILIDIRSSYEYNKGHFPKAINIANNEVLNDENIQLLNSLSEDKKIAVLYGVNPNDALGTWMTIYQLGHPNSKILSVETKYVDKVFVANDLQIEQPIVNYAATLDSLKSKKIVVIETPKKIEKKEAPEGCGSGRKKEKKCSRRRMLISTF